MRRWRPGLGLRALVVSLGVAGAGPGAPASVPLVPTPTSPAAGWATTYLLSTVLAAEYEAVVGAQPAGAAGRGPFYRSAAGRGLWARGRFALTALQARGQDLPAARRLGELLAEHEAALSATPGAAALARTLVQAGEVSPLTAHDDDVTAGFAALAASFALAPTRARWARVVPAFALPTPSCPIDYKDVQMFAAHQQGLLAGGHDAGPRALLAPLSGWSAGQVQCLVFALMAASPAAKAGAGFEPLPLMQALQATGAPLARDVSVTALMAVRYLQLGRYAETLAALLDLSDVDDAFRLPYETVQRIFSMRQRGDGAVALQGL